MTTPCENLVRIERIEESLDNLLELQTSQTGWLASHGQVMQFMESQTEINAKADAKLDKILDNQTDQKVAIAVLKTKSSLWGATGGLLGAIGLWLAKSGFDISGIFR